MRPNSGVLGRQLRKFLTATVELGAEVPGHTDPVTGEFIPAGFEAEWTGPGLVRPESRAASTVRAGGVDLTLKRYAVLVPVDTPKTERVRVTASADPELVGMVLLIVDDPFDDWQALRTMVCTYVE